MHANYDSSILTTLGLQAGFIECGATALFLFFTIGTITSGDALEW